MRIKKDNFLVDFLYGGNPNLLIPEEHRAFSSKIQESAHWVRSLKSSPYVVTDTINRSFIEAYDSIERAFKGGIMDFDSNFSSAYLGSAGNATTLSVEIKDDKIVGVFFAFAQNGVIDQFAQFVYQPNDGFYIDGYDLFGDNRAFYWTILFSLFIKYSDTDTKVLLPKTKINAFNCRYSNLTKEKFTILDSTWLTTLVKSDSFKVRGHFRLQPCGPGLKDRKLIWIDEFKKGGYTRKAGLLKQREANE